MRTKHLSWHGAAIALAFAAAMPVYAATTPDKAGTVVPLMPPAPAAKPVPAAEPAAAAQPAPVVQPEATAQPVAPAQPAATPPAATPEMRGAGEKPIDAQVADRLRTIVTSGQFDKRIDHVSEREGMAAFYAARNYAPLWTSGGKLGARALAVIVQLGHAADDGLDPADYRVPAFGEAASAEALADADLTLTYSALLYARHLAAGQIAPGRVINEVDYGDHTPAPADILKTITNAEDAGAALESFNPPHRGFVVLKAELARLRSGAPLAEPAEPAAKSSRARRAEKPVAPALSRQAEIDTVLANMERWRWLPRDLGETYVMVNVPDYSLKVVHDHQEEWRTKIVAGKPATPTPLLSAQMDNVLVNPSWHVPQSIIRSEYLPRYGHDPNIFARLGLEVKHNHDGTLSVTQPPGAGNALGRIKFNFPNKFSVYLHDTPQKQLFAADKRDFSHGCMRVENPTMFGQVVLRLAMNGPAPDARGLAALFGRSERTFKLDQGPMVHLTYQTAFVDEAGKLQFREDVYGMDDRIRDILHGDERRIADLALPQDATRAGTSPEANRDILRRVERGEVADAYAYFDNLPNLPPREPRRAARARPQAQAAAEFHPQATQTPFPFWPFSLGR